MGKINDTKSHSKLSVKTKRGLKFRRTCQGQKTIGKMSVPDKTSEATNLAERLTNSKSSDNSMSSKNDAADAASKQKSKDDFMNANVSDITKYFNDIDLSFRENVITEDSVSDLMTSEPGTSLQSSDFKHVVEVKELTEAAMNTVAPNVGVANAAAHHLHLHHPHHHHHFPAYDKLPETKVENVENIQVLPEVMNCPKCGRKVAMGAINYHMEFCNPD